jgi:hypothetical protein
MCKDVALWMPKNGIWLTVGRHLGGALPMHELKQDGYRSMTDSYHVQPMYLAFDGVCNLEHDELEVDF